MGDDYGYLTGMGEQDRQVLRNLSSMGEKLKELRQRMLEAEAAYNQAKDEYEHYANSVLPQEMFSAGVDSVSLSSGGRISVEHKFYCQPNKNESDRRLIVEWLRGHGGGHLVESEAKVSSQDIGLLRDGGIPFVESTAVNTQKLKAFLKDGIGATTGVQQFAIDDIPKCVHFQEVTTVALELPK